jgi:GAF domain-containing protein
MAQVDVLAAVPAHKAETYQHNLAMARDFRVQVVSDIQDAFARLADREQHVDVLVLDISLGAVYDFIDDLRHGYPRLFIVTVDEDADFGTPGYADELSTAPFTDNDLVKRIMRLMTDRQMETLRADSLPAVRSLAKELRAAIGQAGKEQTAVTAIKAGGFDYVAYYRLEDEAALRLTLRAQAGPKPVEAIAPRSAAADDLMTWVCQKGQSRITVPTDTPNHPLVARGRLGTAACVPVLFSGERFGVIVACNDRPGSITQDNVMMVELIAAQAAAAIARERSGG